MKKSEHLLEKFNQTTNQQQLFDISVFAAEIVKPKTIQNEKNT